MTSEAVRRIVNDLLDQLASGQLVNLCVTETCMNPFNLETKITQGWQYPTQFGWVHLTDEDLKALENIGFVITRFELQVEPGKNGLVAGATYVFPWGDQGPFAKSWNYRIASVEETEIVIYSYPGAGQPRRYKRTHVEALLSDQAVCRCTKYEPQYAGTVPLLRQVAA